MLWFNPTTRHVDEWNIVNGQWAGSNDIGTYPDAGYRIAGVGDFNNDGSGDVFWHNPSTGATDIWLLQNGKWSASVSPGNHPTGWDVAGIGDFNGDGTSDVLWFNPATGNTEEWLIDNGHWARQHRSRRASGQRDHRRHRRLQRLADERRALAPVRVTAGISNASQAPLSVAAGHAVSCGMADEDQPVTGRCLCGDIRYEYRGAPLKILHCHCESCRRHTSSPVATFVCVDRASFRFTQGAPVAYKSSEHVTRTHCGRCGSPMTYVTEKNNQVDVYIGTLDDPAAVAPTYHVHAEEQLPWFEIADASPRYARGKTGNEPVRHGPKPIA